MRKALPYIIIAVIILILGGTYWKLTHGGRDSLSFLGIGNSGSPQVTAGEGNASNITFKNRGPAPEFSGIDKWLNSEPIKMSDLKGKVVLVQFWTYSSINSIHYFPHLSKWYETYKSQGLVVIGIHTPQYTFERVTENVETAINRFGLTYPIAQDNNYTMWRTYGNIVWPSTYLVDREGKLVYSHLGEGDYDIVESAIQQLIGLPGGVSAGAGPDPNAGKVKTPIMQFGSGHAQFMSNDETLTTDAQVYTFPGKKVNASTYAIEGTWKVDAEKATLIQGYGRIRLNFNSSKLKFAASSIKPVTLKIIVDGNVQPDVTIQAADIYTLFESDQYKARNVEIEIPQSGLEAYTFYFG